MSARYPIDAFVAAVSDEWERARVIFPDQEDTLTLAEWIGVITEELGEVAREVNDSPWGDRIPPERLEHLRGELIQTAAMCGRMYAGVLTRVRAVVEPR